MPETEGSGPVDTKEDALSNHDAPLNLIASGALYNAVPWLESAPRHPTAGAVVRSSPNAHGTLGRHHSPHRRDWLVRQSLYPSTHRRMVGRSDSRLFPR